MIIDIFKNYLEAALVNFHSISIASADGAALALIKNTSLAIVKFNHTGYNKKRNMLLFEWDSVKARKNIRIHDVSFDEVSTAFKDTL